MSWLGRRSERKEKSSAQPPAQDQILILVDALLDKAFNSDNLRPFPQDVLTGMVGSLVEIRQAFGAFAAAVMKAARDQLFLFPLARRPDEWVEIIATAPGFSTRLISSSQANCIASGKWVKIEIE